MTQTIEHLTARVRELEEENAHIKQSRENFAVHAEQTLQQLAASQLHAEQLREALETLNKVSNIGCSLVDDALALPRDTSALDAYVAEKVKEAVSTQKEYYESVFQDGAKRIANLTRQRDNLLAQIDSAVVAMDNLVKQKGRHNTEVVYKWIVEGFSTIKESEEN